MNERVLEESNKVVDTLLYIKKPERNSGRRQGALLASGIVGFSVLWVGRLIFTIAALGLTFLMLSAPEPTLVLVPPLLATLFYWCSLECGAIVCRSAAKFLSGVRQRGNKDLRKSIYSGLAALFFMLLSLASLGLNITTNTGETLAFSPGPVVWGIGVVLALGALWAIIRYDQLDRRDWLAER